MLKTLAFITLAALVSVACSKTEPANAEVTSTIATVKTISAEDAAQLVDKKNVTVLDLRTPEEFAEGHIAGALNINYHDENFETKIAELDRDASYVFHCHSGGRSGNTEKLLQRLGFTNANHMKSGIAGWREAGLPQSIQSSE